MKNAVIIVSGRTGKRFGSKIPKQLLMINKKSMFMWDVAVFSKLNRRCKFRKIR